MTYRIQSEDALTLTPIGRGVWSRSRLPERLGHCTTDLCKLDDQLTLAYSQYHPSQDLQIEHTLDTHDRYLTLTFTLEGESSTQSQEGQNVNFVAGHYTMSALSFARAQRRFPANRAIRQLRLMIQEPLLQRYQLDHLLHGINTHHSAVCISFGQQSAAIQHLAQGLVHLYHRDASLLDLQVAALSLLAEQTRPFALPYDSGTKLCSVEQDIILQARDIMLQNYDKNITIAYLCTMVGTNEWKLKQGFHSLFGTSPHRMLTDIRMAKAWEWLETGLHVSTVAYRVGYKHVSSFSSAFERYYGHRPKTVSKLG